MKCFEMRSDRVREISPLLLVGGIEKDRDFRGLWICAEVLFWDWPSRPKRKRIGWTLLSFRGNANDQDCNLVAVEGAKAWAEENIDGAGAADAAMKGKWHAIDDPLSAVKVRVLRLALLGQFDNDARIPVSEFFQRISSPDAPGTLWDSIAPFGRAQRSED